MENFGSSRSLFIPTVTLVRLIIIPDMCELIQLVYLIKFLPKILISVSSFFLPCSFPALSFSLTTWFVYVSTHFCKDAHSFNLFFALPVQISYKEQQKSDIIRHSELAMISRLHLVQLSHFRI